MLLGDTCTRACRFCNVKTGNPRGRVDAAEPEKIAARRRARWGSPYVVLTMVDRDDLEDGGASHVAADRRRGQAARSPSILVETLVGDFQGREQDLETLAASPVDVLAHNVECVERLTPVGARPAVRLPRSRCAPSSCSSATAAGGCASRRSCSASARPTTRCARRCAICARPASTSSRSASTSSPRRATCRSPSSCSPARFDAWREEAERIGFLFCASGPLVRSSYKAGEMFVERFLRDGMNRRR